MPYAWMPSEDDTRKELHLWPHQSLRPRGYARFLSVTGLLITLPLLPLLGSPLLWALLPFLLLALFGMKYALDRNRRDGQILEVLTLTEDNAQLERRNADGSSQSWQCNRYWTRAELHAEGGPVPNYVTLKGNGREVEIGAFLSEEERKELFQELAKFF
ncbi:hypothetical protein RSK20926_12959 [Roseobacter sp. SK209-2-6]|uniref:DUF2244 domain-containing protein n=1 Tax=Roseobacter sp. SK209-2-6 TaxID=388739 RepID=UPI0000F3C7C3|nr:DUF2244 domain-containing protein [Roseobacter sp. SK209-2-6]EBA18633.1 hypothetical protein RSK20926_12959 [Roseobacter sp. SK209-2-6]